MTVVNGSPCGKAYELGPTACSPTCREYCDLITLFCCTNGGLDDDLECDFCSGSDTLNTVERLVQKLSRSSHVGMIPFSEWSIHSW